MKMPEAKPLHDAEIGHLQSRLKDEALASAAVTGRRPALRRGAIEALLWAVLLSTAAVLFVRQVAVVAFFRFDDSYITLRYAQELVRHGVLSFNPDERIDGYTSLGWTLLLAVSEALGFQTSESMITIGRFFGYASIPAGVALARVLGASWQFAVAVAAVGLLYTPGFVVWSIPGMEMPFAAFIYTVLLVVMIAPRAAVPVPWRVGLMLLAFMVRPEGALLAGLMWLIELGLASKRLASRARTITIASCASLAVLVLLLVAWRWSFYGYPLPNTFYAKASTPALIELGIADAKEFLKHRAIGLALPAALLLSMFMREWRSRLVLLAFSLWFVAVFVVYARSGGDFPGFHRFYQPVVPASFALMAALGARVSELAARRLGRFRWTVHAVLALPLGAQLYDPASPLLVDAAAQDIGKIRSQTDAVEAWKRSGKAIARACAAKDCPRPVRMATRAAGALPFYAQADRVYDMLALNNPEVAHNNPPVRDVPAHQKEATEAQVLAWQPNMIVGHPVIDNADRSGSPPEWWRSAAYEQAGFRYRCIPTELPPEHICFYERQ